MSILLILVFLFVFGVVIGSFLNVVIYRTLHDESPLDGRSRCPHCKHQISWFDNIPILSFIFLQGKCRHCRGSISYTYPVVEFLTGVLFVWWYLGGFLFYSFFKLTESPFGLIQPAFWLIVGILLLIIFITDAIAYIIPDYAVLTLTLLAFAYRTALTLTGIMQPIDFLLSILVAVGCAGGFFLLWFFTGGKGMGFGDVKFCLPMGLLLGWPNMFVGVFVAFVLGAAVGLVSIALRKKTMKAAIPFGPFLVLGTLIALVWGDYLLTWYIGIL